MSFKNSAPQALASEEGSNEFGSSELTKPIGISISFFHRFYE